MKKKSVLKRVSLILTFCTVIGCFSGCKKETAPAIPMELTQNDYRGGLFRLTAVMDDIKEVFMNNKSSEIQKSNPSDYWSSENFATLSSDILNETLINYTSALNETQTDFDTVMSQEKELLGTWTIDGYTVQNISVTRNEPNDYTLSMVKYEIPLWKEEKTGIFVDRIVDVHYDTNHDWLSAKSRSSIDKKDYYYDYFLEYGRNGQYRIVQTENERFVGKYEEVFQDVEQPKLNEKGKKMKDENGNVIMETVQVSLGEKLTEFHYAKLDGKPLRKYYDASKQIMQEEINGYDDVQKIFGVKPIAIQNVTDDGYMTDRFSDKDSIFTDIDKCDMDWVTSEGSFSDEIIYKDGKLTAKLHNKLSDKIDVYAFDEEGNCKKSEEENINVGETVLATELQETPMEDGSFAYSDGTNSYTPVYPLNNVQVISYPGVATQVLSYNDGTDNHYMLYMTYDTMDRSYNKVTVKYGISEESLLPVVNSIEKEKPYEKEDLHKIFEEGNFENMIQKYNSLYNIEVQNN